MAALAARGFRRWFGTGKSLSFVRPIVAPENLVTGSLYYVVSFADEEMTIPIVGTYEYLGPEDPDDPIYVFENVHGEDMLELTDDNLDIVLDVQELIEELSSLQNQWPLACPAISKRQTPSLGTGSRLTRRSRRGFAAGTPCRRCRPVAPHLHVERPHFWVGNHRFGSI